MYVHREILPTAKRSYNLLRWRQGTEVGHTPKHDERPTCSQRYSESAQKTNNTNMSVYGKTHATFVITMPGLRVMARFPHHADETTVRGLFCPYTLAARYTLPSPMAVPAQARHGNLLRK